MGLPALGRLYYRQIRAENGVFADQSPKGAVRMRAFLLAATALVVLTGTAQAQDVAAGEQSFRKCFACHRIGPDVGHLVGPSLNGLEGRKPGTVEGYNEIEANKKAEIVWSEATFHDY